MDSLSYGPIHSRARIDAHRARIGPAATSAYAMQVGAANRRLIASCVDDAIVTGP